MDDRKVKICVQGAAFDTNNMGVSALAAGTVRAILHRYPEAEVFFLNYEKFPTTYTIPFPDRQVAVPLVNMRFSWRFWLRNNGAFLLFLTALMKLLPFPALRRKWIAGNNCLRHLDESDLVVAISGGDSFSDIYGLERLLYVSLPQILALWAGKRLILLPQTLGPFKSRFAQAIAKYIMARAEAVYSRDHAGVKLGLEMLGANARAGKLRFCYDVGFVVEPLPPKRVDIVGLEWPPRRDCCLVGLNISGLLFNRGHQWSDAFGLRLDYKSFVHTIVEFLIRRKDAAVLLIPHLLWPVGEGDPPACEAVYEALKNKFPGKIGLIRATYNQYDQSEIKHIIGRCDFFIGSRMHACIGAISQNVPAVAIAYSDKFAGVMESVGVGSIVVDPRKMGEDEILRVVDQAYEQRTALGRWLKDTIPRVKSQVLELFADVEKQLPASWGKHWA